MRGHSGQGFVGSRRGGSSGRISNWTTLLQPWRSDVATQSVPVSPPPITITSLCRAETQPTSRISSSSMLRVSDDRKSTAKWMPANSRPSTRMSRGRVAPPHRTTASKSVRSWLAGRSLPTSVPVTKVTPSAVMRSARRSTMRLSSFMLGMPYTKQAADAISALEHGDPMPGLVELVRSREA